MLKFLLAAILFCVISTDRIVLAKEGFYLGLNILYTMIEDDFDGVSALIGSQESIALPQVKGAFGLGLLGGLSFNESFAIELNVSDTIHNVQWLGAHGDAEHRVIGLLFKNSFLHAETLHPFLVYGITYNELILKDAAVDLSGRIDDAKLTGLGIDLGVGCDYYFNPRISVGGTLIYHIVEYDHAKGIQESGKVDDGISGGGLGVVLTTAYHF